jgi:uncharacterized membrane protein
MLVGAAVFYPLPAGVQMQAFVETVKAWQLHPAVDHFTVALIVVGILVDLVASIFASRTWLRYMALTLMIVGTAFAWGSKVTGGWEAGRVWDDVNGPALDVLKRHAFLGDWLPWVFLALALWRVGIQFVAFIAGTRPIYLLIAVIAGGVIFYQGHLGGKLVYDYGVGTALMSTGTPAESSQPAPSTAPAEASPLPTVFNPSGSPTPVMPASPASSSSAAPAASPPPTASPTPIASSSPDAGASGSGGTLVNPPGGEASPAASSEESPAPKNL